MKDKTHIVIDLETLDIEPTAAVLSIGYAIVKGGAIADAREHRLNLHEQIGLGRTMSAGTIKWWLDGNKAAAMASLSSRPEELLKNALVAMDNNINVYGGWENAYVWGNSPQFDNVILASLYKAAHREPPWKFWNEMCLRTMRKLPGWKKETPSVPHSAHYDAMAEAQEVCNYLRTLP